MIDSYLSVEEFRDETIMPASQVDEISIAAPHWLERQLVKKTAWINARLRKRYAAPFAAPYPEAVKDWLARIVTPVCYLRLGTNPTDEQAGEIKADRDLAEKEVLEAAESEKGLFDLPLRQDTSASGIAKQGPKVSSQASPYAWMNGQRARARGDDDRSRGG